MPIPGHELVIVRKSADRADRDFALMRGDCTCGRRGCVYYRTTEEVERSFSHHVAYIAEVALTLVNDIERTARTVEDAWAFVRWTLDRIAGARPEERW